MPPKIVSYIFGSSWVHLSLLADFLRRMVDLGSHGETRQAPIVPCFASCTSRRTPPRILDTGFAQLPRGTVAWSGTVTVKHPIRLVGVAVAASTVIVAPTGMGFQS